MCPLAVGRSSHSSGVSHATFLQPPVPPAEPVKQVDTSHASWMKPNSEADFVTGKVVSARVCQSITNMIVAVEKAALTAAKQ